MTNALFTLLAAMAAVFSGAHAVSPSPAFICPKYAICAPLFTPPPPMRPWPPACLERCLPLQPVSRRLVIPAH